MMISERKCLSSDGILRCKKATSFVGGDRPLRLRVTDSSFVDTLKKKKNFCRGFQLVCDVVCNGFSFSRRELKVLKNVSSSYRATWALSRIFFFSLFRVLCVHHLKDPSRSIPQPAGNIATRCRKQ